MGKEHRRGKTVSKAWRVEVEGKQYLIEVQIDSFLGRLFGHLSVDGNKISKWTTSVFSGCVPPNLTFEVCGKKGHVKRKGLLFKSPVLYFDGKELKSL